MILTYRLLNGSHNHGKVSYIVTVERKWHQRMVWCWKGVGEEVSGTVQCDHFETKFMLSCWHHVKYWKICQSLWLPSPYLLFVLDSVLVLEPLPLSNCQCLILLWMGWFWNLFFILSHIVVLSLTSSPCKDDVMLIN